MAGAPGVLSGRLTAENRDRRGQRVRAQPLVETIARCAGFAACPGSGHVVNSGPGRAGRLVPR
jgi:hypothetical protein